MLHYSFFFVYKHPNTGLGAVYRALLLHVLPVLVHCNVVLIYDHQKVNILKPAGYVMHQQFNIQQLYVLPTQYLCVSYLSENKERLVPLTA